MKYKILMGKAGPISSRWGNRKFQQYENTRLDFITDDINVAYRYIEYLAEDGEYAKSGKIEELTIIEVKED